MFIRPAVFGVDMVVVMSDSLYDLSDFLRVLLGILGVSFTV